jgi:DNA-binding CsgD family transcriptional regulator
MRKHLERAVQLAGESGLPAARCETLSRLAVEASRVGVDRADDDLLAVAESSAREASKLIANLPGHPPWGAEADASLARAALHRGREEEAAEFARSAFASLQSAMHEDMYLDVVLPVAGVFQATSAPEWESTRQHLQLSLAMIAQRTLDEDVRVRWFRGPVGCEMTRLAGPLQEIQAAGSGGPAALDGSDTALLRGIIEGRTNREVAQELGISEEALARRLGELFARIGATSRAEATAFAFRERIV